MVSLFIVMKSYGLKNNFIFPLLLELVFSKEIQTVGFLFKRECHCGPLFLLKMGRLKDIK